MGQYICVCCVCVCVYICIYIYIYIYAHMYAPQHEPTPLVPLPPAAIRVVPRHMRPPHACVCVLLMCCSCVGGRGGKGGPGGRRPEVGCGRDGRRRMTALVNNWEAVRLLSSASLRGDAEGRRWASSHTHLFWAKCSAQDVAPITHRPSAAGGRYGASVVARTSGRGHVSEV